MYLLDEKTAKEIETISQRIHNTYSLGMYLDNVYVTEPITSIIDEEYLEDTIYNSIECKSDVQKLYRNYKDIGYVREQLVMYKTELDIIIKNLTLIFEKKSVESAFDVAFGVSDITWEDFELLYTEYHSEVLNIDNVPYGKLAEMYYVILGKPCMTMKEFMSHCTACGGDWIGMLLSGIKECYPGDYGRLKDKCKAINSNSGAEELCLLCDFLSVYITDWKELE